MRQVVGALFFFFSSRRRHTSYWRDWSSDVCSSDLDQKTVQLMLFGMLLITLRDAARIHGRAARRAGATWEEMQAVVNLAFLFGGFSVANLGAQYMQEISEMEGQSSAESTP